MDERQPFLQRLRMLEIMAARAPQGSVRELKIGPPGAVYAMEMAKRAEENRKNPSYVPPWTPGKEKESTNQTSLVEVLKNPLITDDVRAWLKAKEKAK
jgi:hypothetical protein